MNTKTSIVVLPRNDASMQEVFDECLKNMDNLLAEGIECEISIYVSGKLKVLVEGYFDYDDSRDVQPFKYFHSEELKALNFKY